LRGLKQGDNCRTNGGKRCRNADEALRGLKQEKRRLPDNRRDQVATLMRRCVD